MGKLKNKIKARNERSICGEMCEVSTWSGEL